MQFGQSRLNSRGALIAVIKIEIEVGKTDRIFLHQNDDDYKLAQQFVYRNSLSPGVVHHIYERISFSRRSVEVKQSSRQVATPQQLQQNQAQNENTQQHKQITPYENLISRRQEYEFEQSFGHLQKNSKQPTKHTSLFQTNEDTYSRHKIPIELKENQFLEAPVKKLFQNEKEFRLYNNEESSQEEIPVKLFPTKEQYQPTKRQKLHSPPPISSYNRAYDTDNLQKRPQKIQQHQQNRQTVSDYLRSCKSLPKFKAEDRIKFKLDQPTARQISSAKKANDYDKPLHVKILRREQIQQLSQSLKKSISKQDISKISKAVTSRLYNQSQIKKNYLNIIKQKVKLQKEKEMLQDVELTHRPQINKISKVIAQGRRKNDVSIENYLIQEGKKAEQKRQEEANKKYLQQIENCTFQPQLNLISQKLAAQKGKFDRRMIQDKSKRCKYKDQNLFRPSLSKVTYELMRDKGTFETRQRQFLEQKNLKLVEKVKEKRTNQKIDPMTGQLLFKPKINDLGIRQNQGINIGNYLHNLNKEANCKIDSLNVHQPKINQYSSSIVKEMQIRRVSWLFSELDSDQDGLISAQKINIAGIPSELLNIIKPILFEMEQINEQLNLEEFNNSMEVLHKQLTTYERNILYHFKQKSK